MVQSVEELKAEAYRTYVARREAHEAEQAERLRQERKVLIWLDRAEDDAPTFSRVHQAEFESILSSLRNEGVETEALFVANDAVDAVSGYTGQLIISIAQIAAPVLTGALVAWIKGRPGRKVRVEFHPDGKIKKVEAETDKQVLEIIEAARKAEHPVPKKKSK